MLLLRSVVFISVLASALLTASRFVEADDGRGALTQLDGEGGCVARDSVEGCAVGRALDGPGRVAVSRNGKNVYVASVFSEGGVAVFSRDRKTGVLTQLDGEDGCVNDDGADGCAIGRALDGPGSLTVSRDSKSVYVASQNDNAVVVFSRDRETGVLTQLDGEDGCVSNDGADGCSVGRALDGPVRADVGQHDKSVYVSSGQSNAVAVFTRNRSKRRWHRSSGFTAASAP
jgi:DNA-binding beta-propeller fold protein YncE